MRMVDDSGPPEFVLRMDAAEARAMLRPAHEEGNQLGNPINCTTRQPIPLAIRLHPRHQKVALSACDTV